MTTHQIRIRHDLTITVHTRETEAGWQIGKDRAERGLDVLWYSGEYKSEDLALRAAKRRMA
jgi:hypothetical protein